VWQHPSNEIAREHSAEVMAAMTSQVCDNALAAALSCFVEIAHANSDAGEVKTATSTPPPIELGFGLHLGWAIEGAIGSMLKVDASYLSPQVNIAARLQSASKQYDAPLLMSSAFHERLSTSAQRYCRRIDRVTLKGSKSVTELFTTDVSDPLAVPTLAPVAVLTSLKGTRATAVYSGGCAKFDDDAFAASVRRVQASIPSEFGSAFEIGVANYVMGRWTEARRHLEEAQQLHPRDGPTTTLLRFMASSDFEAPLKWRGHRALEK
jgi:hypothetical protein